MGCGGSEGFPEKGTFFKIAQGKGLYDCIPTACYLPSPGGQYWGTGVTSLALSLPSQEVSSSLVKGTQATQMRKTSSF